ncbi:MAG: helix-turn-helix domain-containing protein [Streptosporangiales bacterium]
MPDESGLPQDWWTTNDVAAYLEVTPGTVRAYLARGQMPQADRRMGQMRLWRPRTIRHWASHRPRVNRAQ